MTMQNTEREVLKSVIKEMLAEDSSIVKDAIKEIIAEEQSLQDNETKHEEQLTTTIHKIFDKYDDVFKALA